MVLLDGLAVVALAELGELDVRLEGGAKAEGVIDGFGPRCPLDGVELVQKIGYRCVGMLGSGGSAIAQAAGCPAGA